MDKSELGKLAYEAYWQHEPPPVHIAWESLSEQEQARWNAAASAIVRATQGQTQDKEGTR